MRKFLGPIDYDRDDQRAIIALMVRRANAGALANAAGALVIALICFWAPFWQALLGAIAIRLGAVSLTAWNGKMLQNDLRAGRAITPAVNRMILGLFVGGASWGGILVAIPPAHYQSVVAVALMGLVMVGMTLVSMTASPVPRAMWAFIAGFALVSALAMGFATIDLGPLPLALVALLGIIAGYGHRIAKDVGKSIRTDMENKRMAETLGHLNEELGIALDRADRLARYDQLTGVRNRRAFEEEAGAIAIRRDGVEDWYAALVDLDHFKSINDMHGHHLGDEYLRRVGTILANVERRFDHAVAARLGGEEFVILLPVTSRAEAIAAAEAIRTEVELVRLDGGTQTLETTTSIGLSHWERKEPVHAALRRADQALYEAKSAGRNRVHIADLPGGGAIRAA